MDLFLADADATHARGIALARELPKGSVLLLSGELGAGKTCLVQGIAAGLGISEAVTSPTFALAQHYSHPNAPQQPVLVHLDLYRLELPEAADELFAQEEELAAESGALLALEWPQRLSCTPSQAWQLQLLYCDSGRQLTISPPAAAQ
jgi:tRNA threonylcarbamoyladenosine biosynthesis protein TsaE